MPPGEEIDVHDFQPETRAEPPPAGFGPEAVKAVNFVVDLLARKQVPAKQVKQIVSALANYEVDGSDIPEQDYDEAFDMEKEVKEVLRSVKLLRRSIMNSSGTALKAGVLVSEAKDVISMSNTMINTLMKSHEKIVNMARYRAVEQATIDILRDLESDAKFLAELERYQAEGAHGEGPMTSAFLEALDRRLEN